MLWRDRQIPAVHFCTVRRLHQWDDQGMTDPQVKLQQCPSFLQMPSQVLTHRGVECCMTHKPVCMPQASKVNQKECKSCVIFLRCKRTNYAEASMQALIKNVRRGGADPSGEQAIKEPILANVSFLSPYLSGNLMNPPSRVVIFCGASCPELLYAQTFNTAMSWSRLLEITQIRSKCL